MDRLEDYISRNREDLDKYDPPENVWKGIRENLHHRRRDIIIWLSSAAMIVVILATAVLFYIAKGRENYALTRKEADIRLMKANPELIESEIYYNNIIHDLYLQATPLLTGNPDVEKELIYDMSQLDSICTDIKKDLRDNVANQEVIEALINNYRIKIRILENLLNTLKHDDTSEDKKSDHAL
jgi:hypothetical protein